ncbi:MAG TPA: hypothetical protein VM489_08355 [Burkholderiales bacterium]|nr:hypothetical protein [Burkholderiales bacterium]
MVACSHSQHHARAPGPEHPLVAVLALIAIVAAIVLIVAARFAVHGATDLQAVLLEEELPASAQSPEERDLEAAVTANRFAAGLLH